MPKSQDLFDDSTMSFGEHLEVLRVHLWKAVIGLAIAVVLSLFIGNYVIDVVRGPIDDALARHGIHSEDDVSGFNFIDWVKDVISGQKDLSDGSGITDETPLLLKEFPRLKQVVFENAGVTTSGLKQIRPGVDAGYDPLDVIGLGHLIGTGARCEMNDEYEPVSLSLRGSEASEEDLEKVASMKSIKRLDLQGLEIDDDTLELLEPLAALEVINLSNTAVSNAGMQLLEPFKQLTRVDLRNTEIGDPGLEHLAQIGTLKHLDLRGTQITDAGLEYVGRLSKLEALFVSGRKITDEGLQHLGALTQMKRLEFRQTSVTDAGVKHLAPMKRLEFLSFTRGPLANDRFAASVSPELMQEYTIDVRVRASQLVEMLHGIDPAAYPELSADFDDRVVSFPLSAPEFKEFKETAENFRKPVTLNVQEAFLTYIKVAFIAGLLLASPWVFWQLWQFVAAGLYPHERKYIYVYLPMSLGLFVGGAAFCFYAVFPFVLTFLLGFNEMMNIQPQIRMSEWISFSIVLPLMFGLAFQLPLVMLFLERISIFDATAYREKRRMAILVIAILSMFLTPADPMSMLLMMFPLIILYEFGILLCAYKPAKSPFEGEAA